MIYILAVNEHRYQAINPSNNPYECEFHDYVLKHVRAKRINHLAEEMNDELLQSKYGADESVCRKLANALGLTHSMCELNTEERRQRGIKSRVDFMAEELWHGDGTESSEQVDKKFRAYQRKQFDIRENAWLEKLQPHLSENVLFVCGANHVNSFPRLLKSEGIESRVICKSWKP